MITDIEEGEKALRVDAQANERLLALLGLNTRSTRQAQSDQSVTKNGKLVDRSSTILFSGDFGKSPSVSGIACDRRSPTFAESSGNLLGYQPTTLYKINRAACHTIAERFTAYRRELREKRLQGYREEIRRIALYLQAEQVALTQRHIARYLMQPAILRDPKVRELLREVCRELNASKQGLRDNDTMGKRVWKSEEKEGTCDSPNHLTPIRSSDPYRVAPPV